DVADEEDLGRPAKAQNHSKSRRATVEEVEDEDDLPKATSLKNPIYLFYETVTKNENGNVGDPGDKHYKCRHGNRKIITITRVMRYNVTKLVNHLESSFPIMYRLFLALYTRKDECPTQAEIDLAQGNVPADTAAAKVYLGTVESTTASILKSLEVQAKKAHEKTHGVFEQETFNRLLAEWMVACDQPFEEVDKPEFIRLMEYTHHGATLSFKVPGHTAVAASRKTYIQA
ncbi:hypothetical protein K438DRAFT_2161513, partial [Mycena galopus ATCC 62051]